MRNKSRRVAAPDPVDDDVDGDGGMRISLRRDQDASEELPELPELPTELPELPEVKEEVDDGSYNSALSHNTKTRTKVRSITICHLLL